MVCIDALVHGISSPHNFQMKMKLFQIVVAVLVVMNISSCDKNDGPAPVDPTDVVPLKLEGTGVYTFSGFAPLADKPIKVYYHVPASADSESPALIVFHGNGRDAKDNRDEMVSLSNSRGFVLLVPEFSTEYYPGSDEYHMGNIFVDGDNPSAATLNAEEDWTFSVIDPLFDDFKSRSDLSTNVYDVFGHSAGGQVAHRFFFFKPDAKVDRVISASSGWYTVPDFDIEFPYGFGEAPITEEILKELFSRKLTIMIGEDDTDPNSFALRHNEFADAQGLNRYDRAVHFYSESQAFALELGVSYKWQFKVVANAGHDFSATSSNAVALLY